MELLDYKVGVSLRASCVSVLFEMSRSVGFTEGTSGFWVVKMSIGRPWIWAGLLSFFLFMCLWEITLSMLFTFLLSCHSAVRVSNTYWISSRAFPASSVRSSSLSSWWPSLKNQWLAGRERKWVMCEEPFLLDLFLCCPLLINLGLHLWMSSSFGVHSKFVLSNLTLFLLVTLLLSRENVFHLLKVEAYWRVMVLWSLGKPFGHVAFLWKKEIVFQFLL